jgi:hypothetical protein
LIGGGQTGYDAVLFDLLTALPDSWPPWNAVAGGEDAGRRWRAAYSRSAGAAGTGPRAMPVQSMSHAF